MSERGTGADTPNGERVRRYARWCETCDGWQDITTPCEHQDDEFLFEWKRILIENGSIDGEADADHWALKMLAASFAETLADAPNYTETQVRVKPSGTLDSQALRVVVTVVREGHPTPHELRLKAEAALAALTPAPGSSAATPTHGIRRPRLDESRGGGPKFGFRPEPCKPGEHTFEGEFPDGRCTKCGTPVIDT